MSATLINRRSIVKTIALLILGSVLCFQTQSAAAQKKKTASLEERMNAGLKTRKDEEKKYIKDLVKLVNAGKFPQKLVDVTFFWVRKNKPNHNFPFFYFRRVLELRAKALGFKVPKFG